MATSFAAVLFRPTEVSDRALAQGFAVALGGFDVPAPRLLVAPLRAVPGWSVAFYASGAKGIAQEDELEHACELFEEELPPGLAVLDAATAEGHPEAVVYAITYTDGRLHDDAFRFDAQGVSRHFVHDDDEGVTVGFEAPDAGESHELDAPATEDDEAEMRALDAAARPHRGSTYLSQQLGAPAIPALVGALFEADRRIVIRLVEPDATSIEAEVGRLNRALGRVNGRGAPPSPAAVGGVAPPAAYAAFVSAYDWADPADPQDLYRELAIGAVEGTLRFLRPEDLAALDADAGFRKAASSGLYPIARLMGSALGGGGTKGILALARDAEGLVLVKPSGGIVVAGPTFGELLRYLALGWSKRNEAEEDMIGALMLRARLRVEKGYGAS
ncbi:hypothetical protein [Polyangium aurulentum]|uniref:hypothetical protein n=1 Tax=Polyangium aurulentum TaxID=2567896 RepID=UPI0010AE52E5|nr:hypothetical protein [Polyangium aurulentum]UQA56347.1 hypothetical protein E8A73_034275 [Polyangium aurulentum]